MMSGRNCFAVATNSPKAPHENRLRDKRDVVHWHAVLAQHRSRHCARRQHTTCALTRAFGMRVSSGMNNDCCSARRHAAGAHDVQHANLSKIFVGHDGVRAVSKLAEILAVVGFEDAPVTRWNC